MTELKVGDRIRHTIDWDEFYAENNPHRWGMIIAIDGDEAWIRFEKIPHCYNPNPIQKLDTLEIANKSHPRICECGNEILSHKHSQCFVCWSDDTDRLWP